MSESASPVPPSTPVPQFLNVPELLELSQPRPRPAWFWYGAGVFVLVVMLSTYLGRQSPTAGALMQLFSSFVMVALTGAMVAITWSAVRRHRREQATVEAVEELIQLRRWEQAATVLQELLSRPARTPQTRVRALLYLASVLARYHRFGDAIAVQQHLLDHVRLDAATDYGLRLGRAMAMLHEDHLFDADRAISELRRLAPESGSAGLALVEIYRDVKTGHPDEAVQIFEAEMPVLRKQLGHRAADAYALAARAYDLLGRQAEAARAYENATLLSPAVELQRRYAEVATLQDKYKAADAPAEIGAKVAPAPAAAPSRDAGFDLASSMAVESAQGASSVRPEGR